MMRCIMSRETSTSVLFLIVIAINCQLMCQIVYAAPVVIPIDDDDDPKSCWIDNMCENGWYCSKDTHQRKGSCTPCVKCSDHGKHEGSDSNECAKDIRLCGPCLKGYNEAQDEDRTCVFETKKGVFYDHSSPSDSRSYIASTIEEKPDTFSTKNQAPFRELMMTVFMPTFGSIIIILILILCVVSFAKKYRNRMQYSSDEDETDDETDGEADDHVKEQNNSQGLPSLPNEENFQHRPCCSTNPSRRDIDDRRIITLTCGVRGTLPFERGNGAGEWIVGDAEDSVDGGPRPVNGGITNELRVNLEIRESVHENVANGIDGNGNLPPAIEIDNDDNIDELPELQEEEIEDVLPLIDEDMDNEDGEVNMNERGDPIIDYDYIPMPQLREEVADFDPEAPVLDISSLNRINYSPLSNFDDSGVVANEDEFSNDGMTIENRIVPMLLCPDQMCDDEFVNEET